jgi:hypothetical protein
VMTRTKRISVCRIAFLDAHVGIAKADLDNLPGTVLHIDVKLVGRRPFAVTNHVIESGHGPPLALLVHIPRRDKGPVNFARGARHTPGY